MANWNAYHGKHRVEARVAAIAPPTIVREYCDYSVGNVSQKWNLTGYEGGEGEELKRSSIAWGPISVDPEPVGQDLPEAAMQENRLSFTMPYDLPVGQYLGFDLLFTVESPFENILLDPVDTRKSWALEVDLGSGLRIVTESLFQDFFVLDLDGNRSVRQLRAYLRGLVQVMVPQVRFKFLAWFTISNVGWERKVIPTVATAGFALRISGEQIVPLTDGVGDWEFM